MEWVETTAKTIEAAQAVALDQLGVAADEAEIEIIEQPKAGLFGRVRGEARLRARIKPTQVRAKQERRRRSRSGGSSGEGERSSSSSRKAENGSSDRDGGSARGDGSDSRPSGATRDESASDISGAPAAGTATSSDRPTRDDGRSRSRDRSGNGSQRDKQTKKQEQKMTNPNSVSDDREQSDVSPEEVGAAAVTFMDGLTEAFGVNGVSTLAVDGTELDVTVAGEELGLLVGSGGRTLNAIQDLVRVAAQRRLGDHETRLRIDVAGYRQRRQAALADFARRVADEVRSSGEARSMEPMTSADRKVIHDVLNEESEVESRSEGEDPNRRIVVVPAD
jgi:spoIIIJ-associated protein